MAAALTMEAAVLPMMPEQGLHCTVGAEQASVATVQYGQEHSIHSHAVNEEATLSNYQPVMR